MKKKFCLLLLAIASALCLILGISACGGGGETKTKKVNLGDSPEQVVKLLGEPYAKESSTTFYTYFGSNYLSLMKKSDELEERMMNVQSDKEFEKIFEEMAKLEETFESLVYTKTEIKFTKNAEGNLVVSEVWYDAACSEDEPEKTFVATSVEGVENCTLEEIVQGAVKSLAITDTYSDGSYLKSSIGNGELHFSISGKQVTWQWEDEEGEHTSISKLKKEVPGGLKAEGTYGEEAVFNIPEGTTSIKQEAFKNCKWLTGINIPESVTSIDWEAFEGCPIQTAVIPLRLLRYIPTEALKKLVITSGHLNNGAIGVGSFAGCSALERIEVADDLEDYSSQDGILYDKEKTQVIFVPRAIKGAVTLPESVIKIGEEAFRGCSSLESIVIPEGVSEIGYRAFEDCTSLIEVKWNVINCIVHTSESYPLFKNCSALTTVILGENVQTIPEYAFRGCCSLTSIAIPKSVTSIGYDAFRNCPKLVEVWNYSELPIEKGEYSYGSVAYYAKYVYTTDIKSKQTVTDDGYIFFEDGEEIYLLGHKGNETSLTLPAKSSSGKDYAIYEYAFYGCSSLESVTFEGDSQLISIGDYAFYDCSSLTSIVIPEGVTSIGISAFYGCDSLTSIVIPEGVTSIGNGAFNNTAYYNDENNWDKSGVLYIGNHLIEASRYTISGAYTVKPGTRLIADEAFYGCDSLSSIVIPESITSIGSYAFYGCDSLESVKFEGNSKLTSIGERAFEVSLLEAVYITDVAAWCNIDFGSSSANPLSYAHHLYLDGQEVTELNIPEGVTEIKQYAFKGCSSLTSIVIPQSVISIGDEAFYYCTSLIQVKWNAINCIVHASKSDPLFKNCSALTTVIYGENVQTIPNYVFYGCSSLESVTFEGDSQLTSIGDYAFYGCSSLEIVTFEGDSQLTSIGDYAFYGCSSLESVTFEGDSQLISIGDYAFSGCRSLTSITIPESVTEIGDWAFGNCYKLVEVWNYSNLPIEKGERSYGYVAYYAKQVYTTDVKSKQTVTDDGYIFHEDGEEIYLLGIKGNKTSLTLPTTSPSGKGYAIYQYAFYNFSSLTSIMIPENVTSIGDYAFYGCISLTSIAIPESVTSIGDYAFTNSGLLSITFEGNSKLASIGQDAFRNGVRYVLNAVYITNLAAWCGIDFDGYYANPLSIAHHLYLDGQEVTELNIPDGVTSIGNYAFYDCSSLISITIPKSVTSIGSSAFLGCTSLESVTFEKNSQLTAIGGSAFRGCSSLTSILIPKSVTSIEGSAFEGCDLLERVMFERNSQLTSIGGSAFYGCSSLTSIVIPEGVMEIREYAFKGCSSLKKVYYGGRSSDWGKIIIRIDNSPLTGATRYYYSETVPADGGNWWHFDGVTGEVVEWNKT